MKPVIYNGASEQVIQQLQEQNLYETFMAQVNRTTPGHGQIFILCDKSPHVARYYLYHRGFASDCDNGFSLITVQEPERCPEAVQAVETALAETFDSEVHVLWRDDPQRRN